MANKAKEPLTTVTIARYVCTHMALPRQWLQRVDDKLLGRHSKHVVRSTDVRRERYVTHCVSDC